MTFTAQWQVNQYTLTFDSNDGSTVVVALTQDYGSAVTAPDAFVREGYTFLGWDKDIPSTMPAENQSFKAQWQINKYKVVFVSENDVLSEATLDYGSAITVPEVPDREGYTFLGWEPEVDETVPAHDVTYRAQWNVNKYTLTFDSNGGTDVAAITQDYGTEVTAPAAPTREGYTFLGWDKDIPSTMPAENQSFKAQWQINKYKVVFVSENDVLSEATLDYGSAITVPEVPDREGYTFLGWEPEVDETVPAHDVTYRAQWQVNVYTLTYYVNDEVAYTVEVPYGTAIEPYTPEVPEGYEFKGWVEEVPATMPAHDVDIHGTVTIISGIAEVFVQAGGPVDVYSLQGKLVMRMTNAADARKLPNGIYVVNGVKVLQKR